MGTDTYRYIEAIHVGIFEHYTALHPHESTLKRFEAANECLCSYDLLSGTMRSEQEYGLLSYMAYYIIPIYTHLAAGGNPKAERPTAYWDVRLFPLINRLCLADTPVIAPAVILQN